MARRWMARGGRAALLAVALAGCSDETAGTDDGAGGGAGPRVGRDASDPGDGQDAGATPTDAGAPDGDAPARDAGPTPEADADRPPEADGGPGPDVDAAGPGPDASRPDAGAPSCDFAIPGPADRDRVVLMGFPFGAVAGQRGTEIGAFTLTAEGDFLRNGARLNVGERPNRLLFVPSGELALVLGEDGLLVSVRVRGADDLEIADRVQLPSAGYGDLALADDGFTLYVSGANSTPDGGLSTVLLDCDGRLTLVPEAFFPLRLTDSFALLPGGERAVVRGGQALFDPMDHDDLRLLHRTPDGWAQVVAADIYEDHVTSGRIAVSPDGERALIPNNSLGSAEAGQMVEIAVGDDLQEVNRLHGLDDPGDVMFSPDGQTALLALVEPGVVVVFAERDGRMTETQRIRRVGLAQQMAIIGRGPLAGRVLIPSADPDTGSNLAQLRIDGPGQVADLGQVQFPEGGPNIPDGIAVQP